MEKHQVATNENKMWRAVITLAIDDLFHISPLNRCLSAEIKKNAEEARRFLTERSKHFHQVCDMANVNAGWVIRKIDAVIKDKKLANRVKYEILNF